ncbi:MAG: SCO family protein [Gammaproteobacteria bacterium]|nr:MAG: SCO family protein [Gammaproteobacteria bacterium]
MKRHHLALLALAGVIALVLGFWAGQLNHDEPPLEHGTDMRSAPRALPDFRLQDHNGQPFTPERLQGHWNLLFFGYTHCPDVCPTTLAMLRQAMQAYRELGGNPDDWQVVFVSVDPQRDTLERLREYVRYFDPAFLGVTGDPEQLQRLALGVGVVYGRVENPKDPDNYLVDHSASIIAIDPQGREAAVFSPPHVPQALARDMLILAGSGTDK